MDLTQKKCVPCEGGVPLERGEAELLLAQVPHWELSDDASQIKRTYSCKDFAEALAFVNRIGSIAESEDHHPSIEFGWGVVSVVLTTHSIKGLSENDFIVAAKIDACA